MTNEELAVAIQGGRGDLYPALWDQVYRFVAVRAWERVRATGGYGGVEVQDLIQCGFLALVEAVRHFDPDEGWSFLTILGNCLKTAFARAGGYRTTKRDPLNGCMSLNEPLGDDTDGDTLLDMQADPRDYYLTAEERIWREELRAALEGAVAALPAEEMETLYRRFAQGQTLQDVGASVGVSPDRVKRWEYNGLSRLRAGQHKKALEQFLDEYTDFYTHVGVCAFQRTGQSAVERLAIRREELAAHFRMVGG